MKKRSENLKKFGRRIREMRLAKGFSSQMKLGLKIGTDRTYIGGIERGERNPTFEILEKLAKALGVKMDELLRFHEAKEYTADSKTWVLNDKKKK